MRISPINFASLISAASLSLMGGASAVVTTLGTAAGPETITTNFAAPLAITGLSSAPTKGGDILRISSSVVFTDLNPAGTIDPGNLNLNQNQIILNTGGSATTRYRVNFVRRGGPVGGANQGQFYGVATSDDTGQAGGFAFNGFENANEIGITDALSGQTSDTFRLEVVVTNDASAGTLDLTNFSLTTNVYDGLGALVYAEPGLSGRDMTALFSAATYDVNFGTFRTDYISETTVADGIVTLETVPEPSVSMLLGLVGVGFLARRRR